MSNLLQIREALLEGKEREVQELRVTIRELENKKEGTDRLQLSHERGTNSMRGEIKRLAKVEAEYLGMMDRYHGGSVEKAKAFMHTTALSADCSEIIVKRWRDLNSWRLDEDNMLLLSKLICSERIVQSRALLIDFLRSTLNFDVVEEAEQDETNPMAPRKNDQNHRHLLLQTPEKIKKSKKKQPGPRVFEMAYKQSILFQDNTNKTDIYEISMYPDLLEEGEASKEPNYAVLDVDKFLKYRTEMNADAKVVCTEAGGYLSMSNSMSQRRHCYMHQLTFTKRCEMPLCSRFLFPQTHCEAEMIGKVHFIKGEYTQMLCHGTKLRVDDILYVCKLCLMRSQSPTLARQLLKDLKQDVVDKRAHDEAARRVRGITMVTQAGVYKAGVEAKQERTYNKGKEELLSNKGDDEASDEELNRLTNLLHSFTPPKLPIRARPHSAKPLKTRPPLQKEEIPESPLVMPASTRRSLGQIHPSLSHYAPIPVHGVSIDGASKVTKQEAKCSADTRREIEIMFDEDGINLANSLRKHIPGRKRLAGTSTSPRSIACFS